MDNIQLQMILEDAYKRTFLDKIEFLIEQDKDYKKSDFFKKTKIPLLELYKSFDAYKSKGLDLAKEFNDFIEGINVDNVIELLKEFIEALEQDKKISEVINDIIENFNYEKISDIATMIQEEMQKLNK